MNARKVGVVALLGLAANLAAACDGDGDSRSAPSPSPALSPSETPSSSLPSVDAGAQCVNESRAVADLSLRLEGSARGDVDGDGVEAEDVYLVVDDEGGEGCKAFVVAQTAAGAVAAPVWEVGARGGLPEPRLRGLADIDTRPGQEILVDEAVGASTQFVGAFTMSDGDLVRVEVDVAGAPAGYEDLFPFGGSVGHLEAVDCTDEGTIVVSIATPGKSDQDLEESRYIVERHFLRANGTEMDEIRTERKRVAIDEIETFPEYQAGPFDSC